jgi:hypothetical protein
MPSSVLSPHRHHHSFTSGKPVSKSMPMPANRIRRDGIEDQRKPGGRRAERRKKSPPQTIKRAAFAEARAARQAQLFKY